MDKKAKIYKYTAYFLLLIIIYNIIYILGAHAGIIAPLPPSTPYHPLSQIVIDTATMKTLDDNKDGKIDIEAIEGATFTNIKYVIGSTPNGLNTAQIIWKNTAEDIDFDEVFEKKEFSIYEIEDLPSIFSSSSVIHQGLRCRNENGWQMVACASAVTIDHAIYKNGCYNINARGLTVACMKLW